MAVYQDITQSVVDTWINTALGANSAFTARHGQRFWEVHGVPSEADYKRDNARDIFPYALWEEKPSGKVGMIQHLLPKTYIGRMRDVISVRSVMRYEGQYDRADFNTSTLAMLQALTGVGNANNQVVVHNGSNAIIGYIDMSRFIQFDNNDGPPDGDVRTPERGILIEVVWRGVPL